MLLRFDPLREIERLAESSGLRSTLQVAPMDAYRIGEEFHISVDLPGVQADSIDLTVERNVLTIRSSRETSAPQGADVLVSERPQGEVVRRLALGDGLDSEKISASYDAGVLRLTLPLAERVRARKVEVSSGSRSSSSGIGQQAPTNGAEIFASSTESSNESPREKALSTAG